MLAHTDDIMVKSETKEEVINTTSILIHASQKILLQLNERKTKHIVISRSSSNINSKRKDNYSFEKIDDLKYLSININSKNEYIEINERIKSGNRYYFIDIKL